MIPPSIPSNAPGLHGHLDIVCALDTRGLSILRRQSFQAPIHLSKPHLDHDVLVLNVVNPTAGLLTGDRIDMRVRVDPGAKLLLTAPSASRAHRMHSGRAEVHQHFSVANGGWLESWPEIFIPQAGTHYQQRTSVQIEPGGQLLLIEMLAPGRTASGEAFEYQQLDWSTDITLGDTPIVRERYRLTPRDESIAALRQTFAQAYYASFFIVTPQIDDSAACWPAIRQLHSAQLWIGTSALCAPGAWTIKLLAQDSITLRRAVADVRAALYASLDRPQPALRRS